MEKHGRYCCRQGSLTTLRRGLSGLVLALLTVAPAHAEDVPPEPMWAAISKALGASEAPGDLAAIVKRVGSGPAALEAWTQAHIRFEPYEGIQRGAVGTARARAGNAIDQALLLQALLKEAKKDAVLMTRPLKAAEGQGLLKGFLAGDARGLFADVPRLGDAAVAGFKAAPDAAAAAQKADDDAVATAVAGATRVAPALEKALGKSLRPRQLAAPRTHVWVEVDGVALDPVGSGLGLTGGKALERRDLKMLSHTVVVSLVLRRMRGTKAEEDTLLQVPVSLEDAAWTPIELTLQPDTKKLGLKADDAKKNPKAFATALKGAVIRASLLVGQQRHGAAAFDLKGAKYAVESDGSVGGPEALGGALGGSLGGFGGGLGGGFGGGPKPKGEPATFESVMLRISVTGPSTKLDPVRVHERALVTAKDGELPLVRVMLLAENFVLAPGERERSTLRAALSRKSAFEAFVSGDKAPATKLDESREPAALLMRYADLRRRVQAQLAAQTTTSTQQLRERTGLVAVSEHLVVSGGGFLVQQRFDIFANTVSFVTNSGKLDATAALALGVADTALEAALLGSAAARNKPGTAWDQLGKTDGTEAVAKDGRLLRVAQGEGAWWAVDPSSGNVVGRVAGGGGQGMVEYAWEAASTVCAFAGALSAYAAATPNNEFHMEDIDKWTSRFCSVVTGTEIQTYQMEQISEIRSALWKVVIPALRGVPHPK